MQNKDINVKSWVNMFKIIAGDFEKDIKLNEILGEFILFTSDGYRVRRLNYGVEKLEILDKDQASEILRGEGLNINEFIGDINSNNVYFACYLKDDKKFIAISDEKT